jgi:thioredoxin 1
MFSEGNMSILEVTDTTYQQDVLESTGPVLVDFWAPWCAPCRAVAPELEKIAKQYDGKLRIVKMNVDNNPLTPRSLYITSIPTLIFYPGSNQAPLSIIGATTAQEIAKRFRLNEMV